MTDTATEKVFKKCGVCGELFEKGRERHYTCPQCVAKDYSHLVGTVARTPFEPSGLVKVLLIEPGLYHGKKTAFVEYAEDHPNGYKKGSLGRYFAHELRAQQTSAVSGEHGDSSAQSGVSS